MKKSIIYGGVLTLAVAGATGLVLVNGAQAETVDTSEPLATVSARLAAAESLNVVSSKDETVYVITDASGTPQKNFVGSVLNTGDEKLPFTLSVRYYLDGAEISADELTGKSGQVKIVFAYESTATYQGVRVPFMAVTGLMLDETRFSDATVTNGKIVNDGSRTTIVGYALPGVNEDLGVNILPSEFAIEAKVTGFEMPTVYTLLTNEIFAEVDTSRLSDIDSLVSSMNELGAGLDKIIAGASDLSSGVATLKDKSGELVAGISALDAGLSKLESKSEELVGGATTVFNSLLSSADSAINGKIYATFSPMITAQYGDLPEEQVQAAIANLLSSRYGVSYPVALTIDYAEVLGGLSGLLSSQGLDTSELDAALESLESYQKFYDGVYAYTEGVASVHAGSSQLAAGASALIAGEEELYNGSVTLVNGLSTFKDSGISRLVSVANNDLAGFTRKARSLVSAASNYHYFKNPSAESVKFVVKTVK